MKLENFIVSICFAFIASPAFSQNLKIPQPSSTQTIIQDFGLGKATLTYSRPNVKGRKIFGGLEPYGKVWRTGANNATTITFTDDVTVNGQAVPAGEYGLFSIPGEKEWTVIFSKGSKQWGSYSYKESDDLLRIKIKPIALKEKVETFTCQFSNVFPTSAQLDLMWEKTLIKIDLSTDVDSKVMAGIEDAMKGEKRPYFQAAQYYYSNNKDLGKALEWINEAEKSDQKAPWIKLWKSRIQLKSGDKAGAISTAEAGLKLATEIKNEEYVRLHTAQIKEARK